MARCEHTRGVEKNYDSHNLHYLKPIPGILSSGDFSDIFEIRGAMSFRIHVGCTRYVRHAVQACVVS